MESSLNQYNNKKWKEAVLNPDSTIEEAIRNLDKVSIKIVLVVNGIGEFQGTISDGDIRRGLLNGCGLDDSIQNVIHQNALVVPPNIDRDTVLQLMVANKIQQIPVVNDKHQLQGLFLWDELSSPQLRPNSMIIMAGGKGTRLRPHTENCPKPLLPVAGKPMLEHIIERAKNDGFNNFIISLHYLGHMIEEYFGDGSKWNVNITYLKEDKPLGTAGAIKFLFPVPEQPLLVTNGDVLTDISYSELLDFHMSHDAVGTMAVRLHEWEHPYGVVHTDGVDITGFEEKPVSKSHINAGIYVLEPEVLDFLEPNQFCDMPELFEKLRNARKRTIVYPMHEPWLDVGAPKEYQKANSKQ